ncbi:MAG: DUF99 family protein [Candidatus Woesearchaeota archaeon]
MPRKSPIVVKEEVRTIGIDDGPFDKFKDKNVLIVGTVFRGGLAMDGVLSTRARVDGRNSTKKIAEMINKSKFKAQLRAIFLHGISVGGFNIVDIPRLHKLTGIPVIVAVRDYPNFKRIYSVLKKIGMEDKIALIEKLPKPKKIGKIYIQAVGIDLEQAVALIKRTCTRSFIPEPLRVAHLIAAGVVKGESRGRA